MNTGPVPYFSSKALRNNYPKSFQQGDKVTHLILPGHLLMEDLVLKDVNYCSCKVTQQRQKADFL
jgi:hypothetical protein